MGAITIKQLPTCVRLMNTKKNIDQRGLSGSVVAEKDKYIPPIHSKIHPIQCVDNSSLGPSFPSKQRVPTFPVPGTATLISAVAPNAMWRRWRTFESLSVIPQFSPETAEEECGRHQHRRPQPLRPFERLPLGTQTSPRKTSTTSGTENSTGAVFHRSLHQKAFEHMDIVSAVSIRTTHRMTHHRCTTRGQRRSVRPRAESPSFRQSWEQQWSSLHD